MDIIIPIYQDNIPEIVDETISRLVKNTKNIKLHLVLSSDTQPVNINSVLKDIKSKYFVIMDWDVLVDSDWLPPLIKIMDENKDCGILGVKMTGNNYSGANRDVSDGETIKTDNVAAGLMLCRNVGIKWNEDYPSGYWCDTDFCRQYQKKGLNIYLTGVVSVVHNCQNSGGEYYEDGKKIFSEKWSKESSSDKISLLVLSWNQLETVKKTVDNALKDGLEVWVVDNGSKDGTQEYLQSVKGINVIQFTENMGISYARNRVIERFTREYLLMIDGDIVYIPGSAKMLLFDLTLLPKNTYCLGIHYSDNGERWDGFSEEESDKEWKGAGFIKNDIAIAWTQYGIFKGDLIRKYKFPEYGVFYGPGWGFEDDWIHAKLEEDGYISAYCTSPKYYHNNPHSSMDAVKEENGTSLHNERKEELKRRFPGYLHWEERTR